VIEVFAAIIGASVGVAGISASGLNKRNAESREAVIRLTAGVESIASKLDELHMDMKEDRRQMYSRLNDHDIRIAQLEARVGK
jgi:outer membrane murein-binding lipoprotein Lpp